MNTIVLFPLHKDFILYTCSISLTIVFYCANIMATIKPLIYYSYSNIDLQR